MGCLSTADVARLPRAPTTGGSRRAGGHCPTAGGTSTTGGRSASASHEVVRRSRSRTSLRWTGRSSTPSRGSAGCFGPAGWWDSPGRAPAGSPTCSPAEGVAADASRCQPVGDRTGACRLRGRRGVRAAHRPRPGWTAGDRVVPAAGRLRAGAPAGGRCPLRGSTRSGSSGCSTPSSTATRTGVSGSSSPARPPGPETSWCCPARCGGHWRTGWSASSASRSGAPTSHAARRRPC